MIRIGVDMMGGDLAPQATVEGVISVYPDLKDEAQLVLLGDQDRIVEELKKQGARAEDFEIIHCSEEVTMHDHPTRFLRQKPDSSIAVGFKLHAEGKIDALASAGNTGAMLVGAMYTVKAIPGVIRPSISTLIPKENGGFSILLDVGANADCKPDVLYQFGAIGSLYAENVLGITNPRVGLLNIGEEAKKGNLLTIATHQLMTDSKDYNFVGNIEGRDLFEDRADVIVCDGFTGNVVLKQAEGLFSILQRRNLVDDYFSRFNYEKIGGTPVLGVNGNVIIGHGISNGEAIKNMIKLTKDVVKADLPIRIKEVFQ